MIDDFGSSPLGSYDKAQFEIEGTKLIRYTGDNTVVKIPDGVTEICKNAFIGKREITELFIPKTVTKIAVGEFCGCEKLKFVKMSYGMAQDITKLKKLFGVRFKEIEFSIETDEFGKIVDCGILKYMLKMLREGKITEEKIKEFYEDEDEENDNRSHMSNEIDFDINFKKEDPILMDVMRAVAEAGQVSASFIQRKFQTGYERATKLLDALESKGMIGSSQETGQREVYITPEILNRKFGAPTAKRKRPTLDVGFDIEKEDPHFKAVLKRIVQSGHASIEEVHKKLPLTYNEIIEIFDIFESNGIIGPVRDGIGEVYIDPDMYSTIFGEDPFCEDEFDKATKAEINFSTHKDLIKESLRLFIKKGDAGYALLQTKFQITFRDANKVLSFLEKNNFIGEDRGDGHREVNISQSEFEDLFGEPFEVTMHLADEPFMQMADGQKTVEIRLYDLKRRNLEEGDIITFVHNDDKIAAKITKLIVVSRLRDLSRYILDKAGFSDMPIEKIYDKIATYYDEREIVENMIVAIFFEKGKNV